MSTAIVLFAVFALIMANVSVYATLGLFARNAGLSELQVGAIFAASGLLFFVTSAHWGRLADRHGRRIVIVIGLVATAASMFLFAGLFALQWSDRPAIVLFMALLSARIVYGLLAGGAQPAATAQLADAMPASGKSAAAAWIGSAVGSGSIAGSVVAAQFVERGFPIPLLISGTLALLATALTLTCVPPGRPSPAAAGEPGAVRFATLWPHTTSAFLLYLGLSALQPTTAFFIQDLFKLDAAMAVQRAGLVSATVAGCALVVQAFGVRRLALAPHALLSVGTAIACVGVIGALLASRYPALLVAFGMVGVGYGLAQPGLMAGALLSADGGRQGEIAGRMHAWTSAAWIVGPLVGTALYGLDMRAPLVLAAGALLVLAIPRPEPSLPP